MTGDSRETQILGDALSLLAEWRRRSMVWMDLRYGNRGIMYYWSNTDDPTLIPALIRLGYDPKIEPPLSVAIKEVRRLGLSQALQTIY